MKFRISWGPTPTAEELLNTEERSMSAGLRSWPLQAIELGHDPKRSVHSITFDTDKDELGIQNGLRFTAHAIELLWRKFGLQSFQQLREMPLSEQDISRTIEEPHSELEKELLGRVNELEKTILECAAQLRATRHVMPNRQVAKVRVKLDKAMNQDRAVRWIGTSE